MGCQGGDEIIKAHKLLIKLRNPVILGLVQRKYKSEIGESMGKPDKKLKKMLLILGTTGAVYGSFRFLLPLVIPFLLSWGAAVCLRPSARWISQRVRFRVQFRNRQREIGIPVGAAGAAELLALFIILGWGAFLGGRKIFQEASLLMEQVPEWIRLLDVWLTRACHQIEASFCLKENLLVVLMREMLKGLLETMKEGAMSYLMVNSVTLFKVGVGLSVSLVILLIGTGLCLQEMDCWKKRCRRSIYHAEIQLIAGRLHSALAAWLKTQGAIMVLTAVICTIGLWLMKNPYYVLAGIGVGLLDALPVFGTGTVFIPWAAVLFFQGSWGRGFFLLALYLVCYVMREVLEAKMMGDKIGLSPLETLIAIYAGLKLFGIPGLILGPLGLLLIQDMVEAFE